MRTEAGAVARCERVQARKALIENEIMQCEGELRTLMAGVFNGWDGGNIAFNDKPKTPKGQPLINRKIAAAIAILRKMQKPGPGINIDKPLQASINSLIEALDLIGEMPGPTLDTNQLQSIHLSFKCVATVLQELAQTNKILESQLRPIISTLEYNITDYDTSVDYWVKVLNRIGIILASETDPKLSVPLVSEMGNSILQEK